MSRFFVVLILILGWGTTFAQNKTKPSVQKNIVGKVCEVTDKNEKVTIPMATIRLLNADSSLVKGIVAGPDGSFELTGVSQGTYMISVSFVGFNTLYKTIKPSDFVGKEKIELGELIIKESSIMLAGVVISGQAPEVMVKEDTVEYSPTAYRMQDGAVVEDLLKRLPGVEVDPEGKITSGGKEIRRVFVDGKEFFGNDPKMATKNLTVDIIEKVQVVEKKSDMAILTGVDDGETETIINLTVKKNMKKGWMGNILAGAGDLVDHSAGQDPRYTTNTMINRFLEEDQLSVIVNANNLNRGGNGISNYNSVGANIYKVFNDRLKINGNLRYNNNNDDVERNSFRTNMLIDSVSYRRSRSHNENSSHTVSFNARMDYKHDSLTTIVFSPQLSYRSVNTVNSSWQETLAGDADSTSVNRSDAGTSSETDAFTLGGELTVTRRFSRKGRRLSVRAKADLNHQTGDGKNLSVSEFFLQQDRNKYLDQESDTKSNTYSYSLRVSYVEPLKENMTIQFFYDIRQNQTRNLKQTFDYDPFLESYSILNPEYSKSLNNTFVNQTMGLSLKGVYTKYNYNIGINIVPSYTRSTSFIKDGDSRGNDSTLNEIPGRKVVNYSPQLEFTYRFSKQTNIKLSYRGNTRQPTVNQLDPTPNNTNPLNLRTGNPDLLPSYTNNVSLRFNNNKREKLQSLVATMDYSFTVNEIINFTSYESETGIQHTMPVNENGSWNASGSLMYNFPIGKSQRLKLTTNTRVNYNNRIGFMTVKKQSERNISGTMGASENAGISYNRNWFYGQLLGSIRYSNTSNSLEGKQDQESTNMGITYNTQVNLPAGFNFASDIRYTMTRGLSAGYNKDEIMWNAEISKRFLKGNRGILKLQWTDILQQRSNISRMVTANYIEDNEYNALTSYFLFSFSYRFNTMGKKPANKQYHHSEYNIKKGG